MTHGLLVALALVYLVLPFDAKADVTVLCDGNTYTFKEPITDSQRESSRNLVSQLCEDTGQDGTNFSITGTIKSGDRDNLNILTQGRWFSELIFLNSTGGDVNEAILLGKFIADNTLATHVLGTCYSACVFVFMAGDYRIYAPGIPTALEPGVSITAKLGIHRPTMTEFDPFGDEPIEEIHKRNDKLVRNYMQEMGVNTGLYDLMKTIEPRNVKVLTSLEAERFGLTGSNPTSVEKQLAIYAYQSDADLGVYWEAHNRHWQCKDEAINTGRHVPDWDYTKICGSAGLMAMGFSKEESIQMAQTHHSMAEDRCSSILWNKKSYLGTRESAAAVKSKEFSNCLREIAIELKKINGLTQ